jgi:hypothetical protein
MSSRRCGLGPTQLALSPGVRPRESNQGTSGGATRRFCAIGRAARLLTVTVSDDESATLAADDVGAPIGRGNTIGSPARGLVAVVCLALEISDAATLCDGCNQLALGWEA